MDVASFIGSARRASLPRSGHSLASATRCGNVVRFGQDRHFDLRDSRGCRTVATIGGCLEGLLVSARMRDQTCFIPCSDAFSDATRPASDLGTDREQVQNVYPDWPI